MRELAVDFGTSNTVAALRTGAGAQPRLLSVDGWPVLPSAVWLAPAGGLVVGRDAERQARLDPARYEPNPKRRIDEVEVLLGDTVVAVVDLMAAVLRRTIDEAHRQLGGPPDRLVLTHPAGWGAIRCRTLAAAARRAGAAGAVQLLPEPVAAAAHFAGLAGHALPVGQTLAVYDLGGGTTDTAVVTRTPDGWQVLAEAGLGDVGGRDFDQLLLDQVGRLVGAERPEWQALLRPTDAASRRAARALTDDVRAAKEALSRYPQADVPLPPPLPDVHVTRAELEALARPLLERTAALLTSTIAVAGLAPGALAGIYLVGGASRMPLVAQLLSARLGVLPVAVESPECTVVLGALSAPPQRELTDPRTVGAVFVHPPHSAQHSLPVQPPAVPPPLSPPLPPRRRPSLTARLVALSILLIGAAAGTAVAANSLLDNNQQAAAPTTSSSTVRTTTSTSGTTSTSDLPYLGSGGVQPPEPVQVPVEQRNGAFGADNELRVFAGPAVDRALNCVDPKGSAKQLLGLRTQVQCVYELGDKLYYASFMSANNDQSCEQFASALVLYGSNVNNEQWSGGGRQGSIKLVTLSLPVTMDVVYYSDSGRMLCGLVEGAEDYPLGRSDILDRWRRVIKPGS